MRRFLGLPACAIYSRLLDPDQPAGSSPTDLVQAAGLLDPDQDSPTPRQLRTVRAHLRTLASHGLAHVDEHGRWRATTAAGQACATSDAHHRGVALDHVVRDRIDHERAEFRQRFDAAQRRASWDRQRQHTLARAAKAARARQKAWWDGHEAAVAHRRRAARAEAFAAREPNDQAQRKHQLAAQRARAGEDERVRYDNWLTTIDQAELDQRSAERVLTFRSRPTREQHQLVAAWVEYRARWGLPRHQRRHVTPGRVPRSDPPEAVLLHRGSPNVEELVLFDQSGSRPQRRQANRADVEQTRSG